jgi:hypothetical protein
MAILIFFLYFIGTWIIFIGASILIGAGKVFFMKPKLGAGVSQIISTVVLILAILYAAYLFVSKFEASPSREGLLLIGAGWVILSWLFEIGFLFFIKRKPGRRILEGYDMFRGRAGGLVLLTQFISPALIRIFLIK